MLLTNGERDIVDELNADARPHAGDSDGEEYEECNCGKSSCGECESRYFKACFLEKGETG